ncbi:MAG: NYN domain-containing protein [Candidatus Liptonbacteria bacterium]|nr:NYN domain-containing protein [Candidatus Liptonbacteria bacterium]
MILTKYKDQRVGIFIDVQNLYHSAKNLYGSRVNYKELVKNLLAGRKLVRILAYVVRSDSQTGEGYFFEALSKSGIELREKEIQVYATGVKKANWDVGMAVDAIRIVNSLDVVILVTGDGDFVPLVEYLKWGCGKIVEVAAFSNTTSSKLKESADNFIDLGNTPGVVFKISKEGKTKRI